MIYITFTFEGLIYWMELNNENYALRQIVLSADGSAEISCRDDCLAEGIVLIDEDTAIIRKNDFDTIWKRYSFPYLSIWEEEKKKYPLGKKISGFIKYFYPQGIIIQFEKIQGISDYNICRKNSNPKNLYPDHKITGTVSGYDNQNMWIIISDSIALD